MWPYIFLFSSRTFWLGYISPDGTDVNSWRWLDGSLSRWTSWYSTYPKTDGLACATLTGDANYMLKWKSYSCTGSVNGYICEIPG